MLLNGVIYRETTVLMRLKLLGSFHLVSIISRISIVYATLIAVAYRKYIDRKPSAIDKIHIYERDSHHRTDVQLIRNISIPFVLYIRHLPKGT